MEGANITVKDLQLLVNGINLAQRKGAFSINESGVLADSVNRVLKFIQTVNTPPSMQSETSVESQKENTKNDSNKVVNEEQKENVTMSIS